MLSGGGGERLSIDFRQFAVRKKMLQNLTSHPQPLNRLKATCSSNYFTTSTSLRRVYTIAPAAKVGFENAGGDNERVKRSIAPPYSLRADRGSENAEGGRQM